MRQYGWLRAIYMSFYSRNLYRDVAKNWGLGTFFYLFLLLAICWAVLMVRMQPNIDHNTAMAMSEIVPQMPESMMIKQGAINTPENRPYLIKSTDDKSVIAIIDTSGQYNNLDEAKTRLLVTKNTVLYSDNTNVVKTYTFPPDLNVDVMPVKVKEVVLKMVSWLWVLMLPFLLVISFFYRVLESIFYAIIGKLFSLIANIKIAYVEIVKLAMVAVTPAIIIATVLEWCGIWFDYLGLLFILSMIYLIFGICANRDKADAT